MGSRLSARPCSGKPAGELKSAGYALSAHQIVDSPEPVEQSGQLVQRVGIGPVAESTVRIFMHFHENRVDPGGQRSPRQRLDEMALPIGALASRARQLDRMGRVVNHGE